MTKKIGTTLAHHPSIDSVLRRPRALLFYKSVYTFAKNDNKLNEVVHIALMLNTIYTELGDFAGAEETLLKAVREFFF